MDFIEQKVEKRKGSFPGKWINTFTLNRTLICQNRRWAIFFFENNFFIFFFPTRPTPQNSQN